MTHGKATGVSRLGVASAVAAHGMWGLFPLYWKQLPEVPADQLVFHRFLWSFVLLSILVPLGWAARRWAGWLQASSGQDGTIGRGGPALVPMAEGSRGPDRRQWRVGERCARAGRLVAVHAAAALLIAVNWFAFLWAVQNDAVLEASLGYYINPLLNVLLGVLVLRERLLRIQWTALGIAGFGVAVMTVAAGNVPWVSLAMAASFALYGLIKKKTSLPALGGLWLEMAILAPLSLGYLLDNSGADVNAGASTGWGPATWGLLVGGGLVTIMPLALFALAAHRVPLSLIGVLQYIGPTLQFLVGAVVYGEPLDAGRMLGFAFVWCGVALYLQASARGRSS